MPTSFHKHISDVIDHVIDYKPKTVLDIGVGNGKWGFLCREFLDIYGKGENWQQDTWETVISGFEIYEPYILENKSLKYFYDKIYIGNAIDLYKKNKIKYDLVMFMDVIEHIKKEEGEQFLKKLINDSKNLILSVPLGNFLYQFKGENKAESHVSIWTEEELIKYTKYKEHKIYPLITSSGKEFQVGVFYFG